MNKKKVVIFDLDGVLFDTVDIMHALTFYQYPTMSLEDVKDLHSGNIFQSLKNTTHKKKEETEESLNEYRRVYTEKKSQSQMYQGMRELIEGVHQKDIVVANTSAVIKNCFPMLQQAGVYEYFDCIATKEMHESKVEKFKILAEKYNSNIEDMLFITDTLGDLKEASEVQLPTIAVTWGVHDKSYFSKEQFPNLLAVVDTVAELEKILSK